MPGFEVFGDEERKEVNEVLQTGVLMRYGFDQARAGNWKALAFEEALQEKLSVAHVQLTSSGRAALTVALSCLGVGVGDEVLCPTFTFVASFEAILSVGAIPVLYEIRFVALHPNKNNKISNNLIQNYSQSLQKAITAAPEMWLWSHRRWKLAAEN